MTNKSVTDSDMNLLHALFSISAHNPEKKEGSGELNIAEIIALNMDKAALFCA